MPANIDILSIFLAFIGGIFSNAAFDWLKSTYQSLRGNFSISKPGFMKKSLVQGIKGATQLGYLQALLGYIREWLSLTNTDIIEQILNDLWAIMNHLTIQKYAYEALYSAQMSEQVLAIKKLGKVDNDKYVIPILKSISTNPILSEVIRTIATNILAEKRNHKSRNTNSQPIKVIT